MRSRRLQFDPWIKRIPWRKKWQPTPIFLPEKLHGQRSLAGYSPWCCKESSTTEQLSTQTHTHVLGTVALASLDTYGMLPPWRYFDTGITKGGPGDKESACQCKRRGFNPWVGKIPKRRKWQPTPVFLPGESPWTEEPGSYSPRGHKKLDMTEHTHKEMKKWCTNTQPLSKEKATTSKNFPEK